MSCRICGRGEDTRVGVCFTCAGYESLINDKLDMYDNPIKREIEGSESLNILHSILREYRLKKEKEDE